MLVKDRELGGSDFFLGNSRGVRLREGEREMVEGGSQVEKAIADENAKAVRDLTDPVNADPSMSMSVGERLRRWFRIRLINDAVGFSIDPLADLGIEAIEVFACPIEL
jgi:hypothetical protein